MRARTVLAAVLAGSLSSTGCMTYALAAAEEPKVSVAAALTVAELGIPALIALAPLQPKDSEPLSYPERAAVWIGSTLALDLIVALLWRCS